MHKDDLGLLVEFKADWNSDVVGSRKNNEDGKRLFSSVLGGGEVSKGFNFICISVYLEMGCIEVTQSYRV